MQSQRSKFQKFPWGGMPPDPPSHSMLRMHSMLCTLKTDNDVDYVPLWPYHSKLLATALSHIYCGLYTANRAVTFAWSLVKQDF